MREEELIGEIMMVLLDYAKTLSLGLARHDHEASLEEKVAKQLSALIGKAYADGMPLPGEVARVDTSNPKQWQLIKLFREPGVWMTNRWDAGARIFIALKGGNK